MQIRPFETGDFPQLREFLLREFPDSPQKADDRFFWWRFHQNPIGSSLPHYLLAWENGRVVGQIAGLRDRLHIGGEWLECVWLVDWMVSREHRGGLVGLHLFHEAGRLSPLALGVGVGPHLVSTYKAMRWQRRAVAGTYFSIRRPASLLKLTPEPQDGVLPKLLPLAAPLFGALQYTGAWLRRDPGIAIESWDVFPNEVDSLLADLLPVSGIAPFRSAALLNWKFRGRPAGRHFLLGARRSGALLGYAAVKLMRRGEARWAELVDLVAPPQEPAVFHSLLAETVRRSGKDFVRFRCSHHSQTTHLGRPFWIRHNRDVVDDVFYSAKDAGVSQQLAQAEWDLTSLVSDRTDHGRDEWE
ncbi:MAG: GNAT family N-acetyltransferase [Bryobacterales bacterium]|nr:GNAT family N-acetyltransferase [Bryobacterales bacterium]